MAIGDESFIDRRVTCRILEAKCLNSDRAKICDPYVAVQLDGAEQCSPTVYNNNNPFWSEEFTFDGLAADFSQLSVMVQHRLPDSKAAPLQLGQVVFPKPLLTSGQLDEEQWFALTPCELENSVSGDVRVKMAYFPPKNQITTHTYAVNVISARNLSPRSPAGTSDPFVVLHLLPDRRIKSTQATSVKQGTLSPNFSETFIFVVDEVRPDLELHIAVWHSVGGTNDDLFMGHSSIPIGDVQNGLKSDRWYTLLAKPAHIESLSSGVGHTRWSRRSTQLLNKPRRFVHALQTAGAESSGGTLTTKNKKPHKLVDTKLSSLTFCGHCSGIMWALSSQMQCKECKFFCHVKCAKFTAANCGSVSMIRVKIKYQATPILALSHYTPSLKLLGEKKHSLSIYLGTLVAEREEFARCLITIFDHQGTVENFLTDVISTEVKNAADVPTLFRANSLASKAIDVYMKHVGLDFLQSLLKPIIADIIREKRFCEVDPTRLDRTNDLSVSWRNLTTYFTLIVDTILNSVSNFPLPLRRIFHHLQQDVRARFPNDADCTITSVSGFVFLRYFAPAILGPKLFGLVDEYLDASTSRTLTLLAKSLQNLANLVEFGQKEPYMINMNIVIKAKMNDMRAYIDNISSLKGIQGMQSPLSSKIEVRTVGMRCANLHEIILKVADKITAGINDNNRSLAKGLLQELKEITTAVDSVAHEQKNSTKIKMSSDASDAAPSSFLDSHDDLSSSNTKLLDHASNGRTADEMPRQSGNGRGGAGRDSANNMLSPNTNTVLMRDRDRPVSTLLSDTTPLQSNRNSFTNTSTLDMVMAEALAAGHLKMLHTISIPDGTVSSGITPTDDSYNNTPASSRPVSMYGTVDYSVGTETATSSAKLQPLSEHGDDTATAPVVESKPMSRQQIALMQLQQALNAASNATLESLGDCFSCKQPVLNLTDLHRFEGRLWHKNHFSCTKCNTSLVGRQATMLPDGIVCNQHVPTCSGCDLPVLDTLVQAMDCNWHRDCFVCAGCEIPLTTNYIPFENMPFCRPCYLRHSGLTCGGCGEFIETEFIEIFRRKYHPNCKKCDQCGTSLAGKHFFKLNGQVMCSSHREELMNCHTCHKPIDGQVLIALSKQHQYHPEHFNCTGCKRNLANVEFIEKDGEPMCRGCSIQQSLTMLR